MDQTFIPGMELSRRFYYEAVLPVVQAHLGDMPHTAARIGTGSEVLGFDTARSADHEWGPRLQLFLHPHDARQHAHNLVAVLSDELPKSFLGYPTNFVATGNEHVRSMEFTTGPVFHRVDVTSLDVWFTGNVGFDPRSGITTLDWLATPVQTLAEVTAGAVFHDGLGELAAARSRLAWYPDQVWRYVLACQWQRVSQEEAFVGRCGEVGDELGSAIVAARLVRDLMRLCLLMHRRYPPYSKWLGSAFARLACADTITPAFTAALAATTWHDRETHLATAYSTVARLHNQLGLTEPVDPSTRPYHDRPFQVLHAERFSQALIATITDPGLRALPLTGAIDQFADNTDLLDQRAHTRATTAALTALDT
ncbi:hypothetical protein JOF56_007418 [Kibdelosporangium banguiense]|uniref:DUF4037 domain-containing protein n=1 Tax=Kibdelosporangium banguiense TaxID=1365924 RepID=A0ABS4TRJ5_9PSEU|nr:DUF4037 domain-containing protein [Kibdelosporangium banguiense]MBP2327033.1 hypothetical protein [Kibdelosporangium banguiense]